MATTRPQYHEANQGEQKLANHYKACGIKANVVNRLSENVKGLLNEFKAAEKR
jgi:hypothetical protein